MATPTGAEFYEMVRGFIGDPTSNPRYSDTDLARIADVEIGEVQSMIENYDENAFLNSSDISQSSGATTITLPSDTRMVRNVRRTDSGKDIKFNIIPSTHEAARNTTITGTPYSTGNQYDLYLKDQTLVYVSPIEEAHTVSIDVTKEVSMPSDAETFDESFWNCDTNVLVLLVALGILGAESSRSVYLQSRLSMALSTQAKRRESRDTSTPRMVNYIAS